MNLKEAFQFQNRLKALIDEGCCILRNADNITRVTKTTMQSKVDPNLQDIVTVNCLESEYAGQINQVAAMMLLLLQEREKLSAAVTDAKASANLPAGLDGEVSLNSIRQSVSSVFRSMLSIRNSDCIVHHGGVGYRFNAEGNQCSFRCDQRQVTTVNFDRSRISKYAKELSSKADQMSAAIDAALINTSVAYEAPFDLRDEFRDILAQWTMEGRLV